MEPVNNHTSEMDEAALELIMNCKISEKGIENVPVKIYTKLHGNQNNEIISTDNGQALGIMDEAIDRKMTCVKIRYENPKYIDNC